jgi:hypothetical protein
MSDETMAAEAAPAAPVALTAADTHNPAPVPGPHYTSGRFKGRLSCTMRQSSTGFLLTGTCECEPTSKHINSEYTDGVNAAMAAVFDGTVAGWKAAPTFRQLTVLRGRAAELKAKAEAAAVEQTAAEQQFRDSLLTSGAAIHDVVPFRARAAVARGAADELSVMVADAEAAATRELHSVLQQARQQAFGDGAADRERIMSEIMDFIAPKLVDLEVRAAAQRLDDSTVVARFGTLPGA